MHALIATVAGHTQESPDGGVSAGLIVLGVIVALLVFAAIFVVFSRMSRRSRGGVQPRRGEFHRGEPPLESVGRRATD